VVIYPLKVDNFAIGVLEVANKKEEMTDCEFQVLEEVSDMVSQGIIAYEMKYNIVNASSSSFSLEKRGG